MSDQRIPMSRTRLTQSSLHPAGLAPLLQLSSFDLSPIGQEETWKHPTPLITVTYMMQAKKLGHCIPWR